MSTVKVPTRDYRGTIHQLSRDIMTDWMSQLKSAAGNGVPSAYLMISGNCVEILRCFDILPYFPKSTPCSWRSARTRCPTSSRARRSVTPRTTALCESRHRLHPLRRRWREWDDPQTHRDHLQLRRLQRLHQVVRALRRNTRRPHGHAGHPFRPRGRPQPRRR